MLAIVLKIIISFNIIDSR